MRLSAIRFQIKDRTRRAFGHKVWPHLFRDCAVTSIAIEAPEYLRSATDLMGHGVEATTLRYYNLARTLEAGRMHQRRVREVRREAAERRSEVERDGFASNDAPNTSAIERRSDLPHAPA